MQFIVCVIWHHCLAHHAVRPLHQPMHVPHLYRSVVIIPRWMKYKHFKSHQIKRQLYSVEASEMYSQVRSYIDFKQTDKACMHGRYT